MEVDLSSESLPEILPKTQYLRDSKFLKEEIRSFYLQDVFTDVILRFSDGHLRCHRLVLSSASKYLRSLLLRCPSEEMSVVDLPDFTVYQGKVLLERIYGICGQKGEAIPGEMMPLIDTLRIQHSLPTEVESLLKWDDESSHDSEMMSEEDETPVESLLQSTFTVAIRRSMESIKQCNYCQSSWDDDSKLKNHILIDHRGVVQCSECELHFDEYVEYEAHKEDHYEEKQAQLYDALLPIVKAKPKKAKKKSASKKSVVEEEQTLKSAPSPPKPSSSYRPSSPGAYKCEHCPDKVFESQTILDYHKLRHADRKDSFCCTHCDRRFNSEKGLKYHLNKHEGVADFLCDDCGSRFITRQKLLNHRRSKHTFERPYVCETCGDAFTRSDKLIVHIRRAHTGEKPYQCEFCEWRGVDSSALIHHKKKHGPDKMTKTIKRYVHMPQP